MFPHCIKDYVEADSPVRLFDAFMEGLDMDVLDFGRSRPNFRGCPSCCGYIFMAISMRSVLPEGSNINIDATSK